VCHSQIDSELCVRHEEGEAVCSRAGLSIGQTDCSFTTRSLVRQLVSRGLTGRPDTTVFPVPVPCSLGTRHL
jgi:hypothetical protein